MYTVYIVLRCLPRNAEVAPEEIKAAELLVETLVAVILLQIFPAVLMDLVEIVYQPDAKR
jgi:hypothetical protein